MKRGPNKASVKHRFTLMWEPHPTEMYRDHPCWQWKAARSSAGYGVMGAGGKKIKYAHRMSYEIFVGPIPDGLEIDHLCRNRWCINPSHLDATTHRDNCLRGVSKNAENARKTHCIRGHEYTEANTIRKGNKGRWRECRRCANDATLRRYHAKRNRPA